jgi:hypothetical protein
MRSVSYQRKVGDCFFPELIVLSFSHVRVGPLIGLLPSHFPVKVYEFPISSIRSTHRIHLILLDRITLATNYGSHCAYRHIYLFALTENSDLGGGGGGV